MTSDNPEQSQRCGFASVLGTPNAGKSTLMNALVGAKISIVSRKVQTTRTRVLGILPYKDTQVILIDTPGVFQPSHTLEKAMVSAALDSIKEGDVVLHLVDVSDRKAIEKNKMILQNLPNDRPVYLVLNKVDKIDKEKLLALTSEFHEHKDYARTFMISALKKKGLTELLEALNEDLPEGPWHYDEDQMTTMPMRMLAAEITREKIYDQLHQEIPYSVMVETEQWENFDNGSVKINQIITVQKASQKGIVLGKQGARVKQIGQDARMELEDLLECRVHLKLFVRVQENWQERPETYQSMGLSDFYKS